MNKAVRKKSDPQRNKLLAKIHILYPQQDLTQQDYWEILEREFGPRSRKGLSDEELKKGRRTAKYLSNLELQYLVERLGGNKPKSKNCGPQIERLRSRAWELAGKIENGDRRLKGLVKKILKMDRLEWCRDVGRLKRLLAVLEKLKKETEALWD